MHPTTAPKPPSEDGWVQLLSALRDARKLLDQARSPLASDAVRSVGDDLLMEVHDELAGGKRSWDLMMASTGGEIGRRSEPSRGAAGIARKRGFKSPAEMLATETGGSQREARNLIEAGRAMTDAQEQSRAEQEAKAAGKPAPAPEMPVYPVVAQALSRGDIGVDAASAITRMLDSVRAYVPDAAVVAAEKQLTTKAPGLTAEQFRAVVRRHSSWLRANSAEERQKQLVSERFLVIKEQSDGSVDLRARFDPATAAPIRAAFDSMVKDALRKRREGDNIAEDTRTPGQVRADAMATFARHMLGCEEAPTRPTTTVQVRIGFEEMCTGLGAGEIEGGDGLVPAGRLRQVAVDAEYLPMVLGGASEVLDLGRKRRMFSTAQRTALLERDGGCAMCGAPPSHCEAHHIEWWNRDGGKSDLANGVMLCVACHHIVHQGNWGIEATSTQVYFVPPRAVDPSRRPRLGGRERFGVSGSEREQLLATGPPGDPAPPNNLTAQMESAPPGELVPPDDLVPLGELAPPHKPARLGEPTPAK